MNKQKWAAKLKNIPVVEPDDLDREMIAEAEKENNGLHAKCLEQVKSEIE